MKERRASERKRLKERNGQKHKMWNFRMEWYLTQFPRNAPLKRWCLDNYLEKMKRGVWVHGYVAKEALQLRKTRTGWRVDSLLLQRTWLWFPPSTSDSFQPPVTLAPREIWHLQPPICIHTDILIYMQLKLIFFLCEKGQKCVQKTEASEEWHRAQCVW